MGKTTLTPREHFEELVRRMRRHQRAYFRSRDPRDLNRSKELESKVDAYLGGRMSRDLFDEGE